MNTKKPYLLEEKGGKKFGFFFLTVDTECTAVRLRLNGVGPIPKTEYFSKTPGCDF